MAFRFTLATVLRLREIAEQREERLLGQIQAQIGAVRQNLIDLAAQRQSLLSRREDAIQRKASAAEISGFYGDLRTVDHLVEAGKDQLTKLEVLRDQQMKIYQSAHGKRELLDGMRQEKKAEYEHELDRKEQSALDDNFSSRRARN